MLPPNREPIRVSDPRRVILALVMILVPFTGYAQFHGPAPPDSISFQGHITDDMDNPINGPTNLTFKLYKGPQLVWTQTKIGVPVTDGRFSVILGGPGTASLDSVAFDQPIDLGITIDTDAETSPRIPLTAAPFALGMRGLYAVEKSSISGSVALNLVGGAENNFVAATAVGATIGGGGGIWQGESAPDSALGSWTTIAGGARNKADDSYTTVGGGFNNKAEGVASTISGGQDNVANGARVTIGGGSENTVTRDYSTIGGGTRNEVVGDFAVVAGGRDNSATDDFTAIAGGTDNVTSDVWAAVFGGFRNTASGIRSFVGGGSDNVAQGDNSTVGGGTANTVTGDQSVISGGANNLASGHRSAVGGGLGQCHDRRSGFRWGR